eukprot:1247800-Prymnesium_polylepis.1
MCIRGARSSTRIASRSRYFAAPSTQRGSVRRRARQAERAASSSASVSSSRRDARASSGGSPQ